MDLERTVLARRFAQLQARCEQKRLHGKEEDPVLSPKREGLRKETEKEISKGKNPKVSVRQESQINRSVFISRRSSATRKPHATILAPTKMLTLQIPEWTQMGDTCVFKHRGKASEE